jgi:hypothetical protein
LEGLNDLRDLVPNYGRYEVIMTGVCTLYWRPFGGRKKTRIPELEKFDGDEIGGLMKSIHDSVDEARNQVLAHQQIDGWDAKLKHVVDALPATEVVVRVRPHLGVEYPTLLPPANLHDLMPRLVAFQMRRAESLRLQLLHHLIPSSVTDDLVTLASSDSNTRPAV